MHRYDTSVSLDNTNVSHTQMVLLVGGNKRVLDVGCATGYVAKELVAHGCMVSGVDVSEEAAELARPHLERLVIGDLETLDLLAEFGAASFDAVVFGDVLEHLRDPVPVLRQTRDLLAPGGFVVISIPNIAHGDVRFALLQGRWDYRPIGLLDETHLRFFTREGVERMLWEAGFASVEMRRIRAELFTTEIGVRPEEFEMAVVEQIRRDPESTTYQFVLKAAPSDADTAIRQLREREEAQRVRIMELEREAAERTQQVADLAGKVSRLLELEAELRERLARAEAELDALRATRTMRLTRVPRMVYARLRGQLSGEGRRSAR